MISLFPARLFQGNTLGGHKKVLIMPIQYIFISLAKAISRPQKGGSSI
jgi:hypothetical protein